jgi:hypothetical protein
MDENLETLLASIVETTTREAEAVLLYYDGPQLIIVRTESNQAYIASHSDETDTTDIWLYAMVSDENLENITTGQEGWREVYSSGKYRVFSITYHYDKNQNKDETTAEELVPTEIREEWLPSHNTFL